MTFNMFEAFTHIGRFISIARILARHDALFALEYLKVAPGYVTLAKLISKRNVEGRPGQRLALALNEAGPSFINDKTKSSKYSSQKNAILT